MSNTMYIISAIQQSDGAVRYNATRDRSAAARAREAIRYDRTRLEHQRGEYVFEVSPNGAMVAYDWPTEGVPRSVTRSEFDAMRACAKAAGAMVEYDWHGGCAQGN